VLRVVDPDSSIVLITESGAARNADALIPELEALTRKIRARLGERRASLQKDPEAIQCITSSFEAYRELKLARNGTGGLGSLAHARRALELDPEFAWAWVTIAIWYSNHQMPDSSLSAYERAWALSRRLLPQQRPRVEARLARARGDYGSAARVLRAGLADRPDDGPLLAFAGLLFSEMDDFEAAVEIHRSLIANSLFPGKAPATFNIVYNLLCLGRFEEARRYAQMIEDPPTRDYLLANTAVAIHDWRTADSLFRKSANYPNQDEGDRVGTLSACVAVRMARGAFAEGVAELRRLERSGNDAESGNYALVGRLARTACLFAGEVPAGVEPKARSTDPIERGIWMTLAGKFDEAEQLLASAEGSSGKDTGVKGHERSLLRALLALHARRWDDALSEAAPFVKQPTDPQGDNEGFAIWRFVAATAFEQSGRADSAVVHLDRALNDFGANFDYCEFNAVAYPFLRQRLAVLNARLGRLPEARRHYAALVAECTLADATMKRRIDEARLAIAAADAGKTVSGGPASAAPTR
jgi:tetratricopeptide (TPR) repeat protein